MTNAAFDEDLDEDEFADGKVASVVLRMVFHDYLVRDMDVLYENTMTVRPLKIAAVDVSLRFGRVRNAPIVTAIETRRNDDGTA